jgi:esterase/lipase
MNLNISENINQLCNQIQSARNEILKAEGSLLVFQQLKDMGVETIEVNKKGQLESNEENEKMSLSIDTNINQFFVQIQNAKNEILKMEGSILVFQQLKDMGVDNIKVNKKEILESKEVNDVPA